MKTWAIVKSGAKQYKVEEGSKIDVEKLKGNDTSSVSLNEVLLIVKDDKVEIGNPTVKGGKVKAKVLENFKEKKIRVVKFKSKSRYLRTRGHRQQKTKVLIEKIVSR